MKRGKYINTSEAAERLNMTRTNLWYHMNNNDLFKGKTRNFGKFVWIEESAVDELTKEN